MTGRAFVEWLCLRLDLPFDTVTATDPFFLGAADPKFAMQKLDCRKHEVVCDGVAIASINRHGEYFGERMEISTASGRAHSGCVAFGLERWLGALQRRYGSKPADWPAIDAQWACAADRRTA